MIFAPKRVWAHFLSKIFFCRFLFKNDTEKAKSKSHISNISIPNSTKYFEWFRSWPKGKILDRNRSKMAKIFIKAQNSQIFECRKINFMARNVTWKRKRRRLTWKFSRNLIIGAEISFTTLIFMYHRFHEILWFSKKGSWSNRKAILNFGLAWNAAKNVNI